MSQVCPAQSCRLQDVLVTEELRRRTARKNFAAENRALTARAQELGNVPEAVQNRLTDLVLELGHADSAGISLLEWHELRASLKAPGGTPQSARSREGLPRGVFLDRSVIA